MDFIIEYTPHLILAVITVFGGFFVYQARKGALRDN